MFQAKAGDDSQGSQSRVPAAFKSFSYSQKEKTLNDLIQDQWLCSTSESKIGLGVRSFLDLRSWFRINEIPSCDVCNETSVKVWFILFILSAFFLLSSSLKCATVYYKIKDKLYLKKTPHRLG